MTDTGTDTGTETGRVPGGQRDGSGATDPVVRAEVREDGSGQVSIDGVTQRVQTGSLAEAGAAITRRIAALAADAGHPLTAQVRDPDGEWSLLIHPDGTVDEAGSQALDDPGTAPGRPAAGGTPDTSAPATTGAGPAADAAPAGSPASTDTPTTTFAAAGSTPGAPASTGGALPTLEDLLAARRHPTDGPATRGWRVGVRRATFGAAKPSPGPAERRERAAIEAVRRPFDGPRTIVVVNPKGGANKTTAALMLASTFGQHRGGYTLAWDNNETRGTLGWRSAHGEHTRTAVDLLRDLPRLTAHGTERIGDLDTYVRSQGAQQFDVLASDEDAASAASVDAEAFRSLHSVLSRFYRVLVVDTGNNMRASNWQAAVAAADQLVVVSTVREDTAQSAAWALDALRSMGHEDAVRGAVTVLSAPEPKVDKDLRDRLRGHFGALTRAVLEVPHDPGLVSGGPIDYAGLDRSTRDAWLAVSASVAGGL